MKKLLSMAVAAALISSCQNADLPSEDTSFNMNVTTADYAAATLPVQNVSTDITSNTTWTNDKVWELTGVVKVKDGATLTIEAGTYIKSDGVTADPNGVLVITRNGAINAVGTATNPIVFTSHKLLDGNTSNSPAPGDFGGVIVLGDAPTNTGSNDNQIEGLENDSDFYYGGSDATDNRGTLQYVRIEFAGSDLTGPNSGNEVNGLTLGGVGSGTTIDHIQVSYGLDDGVEFFGGTVDVDYVIVFAQTDDGLDIDQGYTGNITKALVLADKNSDHSGGATPDSNGIELNSGGVSDTPVTRPVITDLSIVGVSYPAAADLYENGIHVRENGEIDLTNATVTGYNTGIFWDTSAGSNYADSADSSWSNFQSHGFDDATVPVVSLGFGNTSSVNPANKWSLTQPFFNDGGFNLSGNTGAFATETGWATATWTEYNF